MREGWIETTLGEIADVIGGGTPSTSVPEYWGNEFIWLTPTEIVAIDGKTVHDSIRKLSREGLANSGAQILPRGSVILTSRASVGYVAISECELSTNQGFQSLVPKEKVLAYFLMYWIQNNRNEFESRAAGSTFKEISKTNVKSIKLYLPPIPEQKRIVDLISTIDSYIEALEQQAESARKSRSAVLHEMLSAGGDGWVNTTLGKVSSCAGGSAFPLRHQGNNEGIPFIKVSDMNLPGNELIIHFASNYISEEIAARLKARIWPKDTVIFPKVGAALLTNKRRILSVPTIFDNNIMGLVCSDQLNPNFLFYFMQTIDMNDYVQNGALPSISNEIVKAIDIPLPPLHEQERIINIISSLDDGIAATENLISETKQLRTGLLSDLLSGDHEIPESYDKVMVST